MLLALLALGSAGAVGTMWSVDDPRFAAPPASPSGWAGWLASRDVLDAVAALARLATTAVIAVLVVTGTAHLLASLWGSAGLRRRTARFTPAPLAGLVAAAVLGSGPGLGSVAGAAEDAPGPPTELPVDRSVGPAAGPTVGPTLEDARDAPLRGTGATMRVLEGRSAVMTRREPAPTDDVPVTDAPAPGLPAPGATPIELAAAGSALPAPTPTGDGPAAAPVVVVAPGDHLWAIAERRVALATGDPPTEPAVRTYWLALIDANRDLLVEPGNPDMVLPGQVLRLPG
jgi:LysM repeat protein